MKFTSMLFALVAIATSAVPCIADVPQVHGNLTETNVIVGGQNTFRGTIYLTRSFNQTIGSFVWAQVDKGYAQVYAGPSVNPTAWSSVAAGIGIEQGSSKVRFGSSLWLGHGRFSAIVIDEEGGNSGTFRKIDAAVQVASWLQVGWFADNILGSGPKATVSVPHTPFQVWGVAQRDGQQVVMQVNF